MAYLYIAITIFFTVAGQILIKMGMADLGASPDAVGGTLAFALRAFLNWKVIGGLGSAGLAAVAWMLALSRADISVAYPFMGLPIVLVLALSPVVFGEHVPMTRWIGVAVVCLGLFISAQG